MAVQGELWHAFHSGALWELYLDTSQRELKLRLVRPSLDSARTASITSSDQSNAQSPPTSSQSAESLHVAVRVASVQVSANLEWLYVVVCV